jgi:hypothetical protein
MKFNELQKTLGTLIVERAQLELGTTRSINGKKVRRVASGDLRKNLQYTINGKNILFGAKPPSNDYASFVHYGVNGTKKNQGSQFSFGSKQPPSSPILRWMKQKRIRPRDANGSFKSFSNSEQAENANLNLAIRIAKSIKEKGITPLPYYDMAIKYAFQTQKDLIEKALVKDIELNLDL